MVRISIIGTGYVGLTAACLADLGHELYFIDRTKEKIDKINKGILPIYESGLEDILKRNISSGKIKATTSYDPVENSDVVFVCVGTPSNKDGSTDLSDVKNSSIEIGKHLKNTDKYQVVTVKSTVVPGTTRNVVKPILEKYSGKNCGDFGLCMNPEFLREGSGIYDFLNPDKIVIGCYDDRSYSYLEKIYEKLDKEIPRIKTNLTTAEMIKYVQNSFLAARISLINEFANFCEKISSVSGETVDITEVKHSIGLDKRIGSLFLNAGCGFGGSCFPKDINAILAQAKSLGYDLSILNAIMSVNRLQPYRMIELTKEAVGEDLKNKKIAVLGLAFKPNTDDMREAPSILIINSLVEQGASVKVYDPKAMENAKKIFGNSVEYSSSKEDCVEGADVCLFVTEWDEFKKFDLETLKCPIIDGRRIFDPKEVKKHGLIYRAIGRGEIR